VTTVADLRSDPHLEAAGFWRDDEHPTLGTVPGPGAAFRVNHDWWRFACAPRLGEHNLS
jgi:crotonobetainyl-CoA:carnitine CoA-transferase CaiB-like acyl-CoA transferase